MIAYAVIFEGLSPATAMAIFILGFLRSAPPPSESLPLYLLLVRLLTNLGVVVAAILAFSGRSIGRWSLPVLVAVNHLLAMPIFLYLATRGPIPPDALAMLIRVSLIGLVVPAIYLWYFSRRRTTSFYMRP